MRKSALFLDRDGVVNEDLGYVHRKEDFRFIKGIFNLCRAAKSSGMSVIIVTNQAGIGRGYFTEEQFHCLTEWMLERFEREYITIDGVYYCPFHPKHGKGSYKRNSNDRKPRPGMIYRARDEHSLDLSSSVLIGDKESDIEAARNACIGTAVLFSKHYKQHMCSPDIMVSCLDKLTELLQRYKNLNVVSTDFFKI